MAGSEIDRDDVWDTDADVDATAIDIDIDIDRIKKVTLAFDGEVLEFAGFEGLSQYIARTEKLGELRSLQGRTLFVMRVTVTEAVSNPREMVDRFGVLEVQIIKADHPDYTVFYRIQPNPLLGEILDELDYDVYFTIPEYYTGDEYVVSFYTHHSTLQELLRILHDIGIEFTVRSVTPPVFTGEYLLRELTAKQFEMLLLASKEGYYEIPREVSAKALAKRAGISVQMVHEHLRKAENKLMRNLLGDYIPHEK